MLYGSQGGKHIPETVPLPRQRNIGVDETGHSQFDFRGAVRHSNRAGETPPDGGHVQHDDRDQPCRQRLQEISGSLRVQDVEAAGLWADGHTVSGRARMDVQGAHGDLRQL